MCNLNINGHLFTKKQTIFLKVASFGEAKVVKEKIAPETFFLWIFWPIPYKFASELVNKTFFSPFLNCQNIFKQYGVEFEKKNTFTTPRWS